MKKLRRVLIWLGVLVILAGAGAFGYSKLKANNSVAARPTASARKGDFTAIIRCRGELKARKSIQVTAPCRNCGSCGSRTRALR